MSNDMGQQTIASIVAGFVTGGRKFTAVDGVSFFVVMIVPGWGAAVLRLYSR
jgi:hypothetical protein